MGHILDLRSLATALDGDVNGHQVLAPGPGHSQTDRSMSVKLTDINADGFVTHSFAGDDVNDCRDLVRERIGQPRWEPGANDRSSAAGQSKAARKPLPSIEDDPWTCITPVPEEAFPLDVRLGGRDPQTTWLFKDAAGRVLGVECRWLKTVGKDIRFACWCRHQDGRTAWRLKHLPSPRPLYGLDRLAKAPLAPVLIVEGAKKVAPATKLFPDHLAVAWPGGAEGVKNVDWSQLAGRKVTVWPDNDEAGRKAAARIAEHARKVGADSVAVVAVPSDFPPKWDLADPVPDGADLGALLDAAKPPRKPKPEADLPSGYRMTDRGLVWSDPHDDEKPEIVISGRFDVLAESRDDNGQSWGVLLRWLDQDGRSREWSMPRALLAGDGTEIQKVFLDGGLYLAYGEGAKRRLLGFLAAVHSPVRARAVSTTGWYYTAFVLPDGAIGQSNGERAILQTGGAVNHAYNVRGTLENWKTEVARHAVGNSRLALALSAAFAAALVGPCDEESGGIHFRGNSSVGKSTALTIAGSVWGGGKEKYVRSWRTTSNGLEAVATAHNDTLLCLDELAMITGREAGEVAYMLANGSGKARASRDALLRKSSTWKLLFLSSGEMSLAEKIAEDTRGHRQTAGQAVRVVEVPADTKRFGLFEDLHGFADGPTFAKHLTTAGLRCFGTPARAFIDRVASDLDDHVRDAKASIRDFVTRHCPADADGQVSRVAQRFGLIAAAGEMAVGMGILPWPEGEATWAAGVCLEAWIGQRGGIESSEVTEGIRAVRTFLSAHGKSRFLAAWEPRADDTLVLNLAGFRRRPGDGGPQCDKHAAFDFFVTPEAWGEVCAGFDAKSVAAALIARGFLKKPESGNHRAVFMHVPGQGKRRLYHIGASIFGGDDA